MVNYILRCEHCGKMFKCVHKHNDIYTTDFNDKLQNGTKCPHCGNNTNYDVQTTEDWIADLVFTIKGK